MLKLTISFITVTHALCQEGCSPLMEAFKYDRQDVVSLLLSRGALVDDLLDVSKYFEIFLQRIVIFITTFSSLFTKIAGKEARAFSRQRDKVSRRGQVLAQSDVSILLH